MHIFIQSGSTMPEPNVAAHSLHQKCDYPYNFGAVSLYQVAQFTLHILGGWQ